MRLIDISKLNAIDLWGEDGDCHVVYDYDEIHNAPTVEAILKEQYEARLRADMIAMLEELQKEVNELHIDYPMAEYDEDLNRGIAMADDVIQQKINYWRKKK